MSNYLHSPAHYQAEAGAFIVTSSTYNKLHHFSSPVRLALLQDTLLELAEHYGWRLQAWSVMSNHYHFIALSPSDPAGLGKFVGHVHTHTAREINRMDACPGRKVWYQYWDTRITNQRSYYARLNYVHQNPVHHGLALVASEYKWCSAAWFDKTADPTLRRVVTSFKTDRVRVPDDFASVAGGVKPPPFRAASGCRTPEARPSAQ